MNNIEQREYDHKQAFRFDVLTERGVLKVLLIDYISLINNLQPTEINLKRKEEATRLIALLERWDAQ